MPVVTIPTGVTDFPSANGVNIPSRINGFTLTLTTTNWPSATVTVDLLASFDGGQTFQNKGSTSFTGPWTPTPAKPNSPDLQMTAGWGGDQPSPDHIKARTTNPAGAFQSTFNIVTQ